MVSRIPAKVSAFEKMFLRLEKIFSITQKMVGNDRRCKLHHSNNLIIDQEDGRKDEEDLLAAFDHNLFKKGLGSGDEEDGCKPSDYVLHYREDGPHVQENLIVREEHGRLNKEYLLHGAAYHLYVRDLGHGLEEDI
jgi:hypothetical protein